MTRAQRIADRALERAGLHYLDEAPDIRAAIEAAVRVAFEVAADYVDNDLECSHGTAIGGVAEKIRALPDEVGP